MYNFKEEEKEAIEKLKRTSQQCHHSKCWEIQSCDDCYVEVEDILAIDTVLNLLEKQQKKIEILEQNYGVSIEQIKTYKANIYDLKKEIDNIKEIEQQHKIDNGLLRQELDMQIEHNKELEKYKTYYEEMEEVNKKFISVDKIKEHFEILNKATKHQSYLQNYMILGDTECATGWFINLDFIEKVLLNEPGYTIEKEGGE